MVLAHRVLSAELVGLLFVAAGIVSMTALACLVVYWLATDKKQ